MERYSGFMLEVDEFVILKIWDSRDLVTERTWEDAHQYTQKAGGKLHSLESRTIALYKRMILPSLVLSFV